MKNGKVRAKNQTDTFQLSQYFLEPISDAQGGTDFDRVGYYVKVEKPLRPSKASPIPSPRAEEEQKPVKPVNLTREGPLPHRQVESGCRFLTGFLS